MTTRSLSPEERLLNSRWYAQFWRWHFLTGFFAVPVLVVVALTGAVLTFQDELHPLLYPRIDLVAPSGERASLDAQVRAAIDAYPQIRILRMIVYPPGSNRSTIIRFAFLEPVQDIWNPWGEGEIRVNPYNGRVVGMLTESQDVFRLITNLHKSFFLKLPGELIVDFATGWGVISILAGLYLWWPWRSDKVWGVWLPRFTKGRRLFLRDLHTVPSFYLAPVALVVMLSGVLLGWSSVPILLTQYATHQLPTELVLWATSETPHTTQTAPLDAILKSMGPFPGAGPYSLITPNGADGAYLVEYGKYSDAVSYRGAIVDQYSAKVLVDYTPSTLPAGSRFFHLYVFNEVLHRGAYWGDVGKTLTFLACVLVAIMCVTSWLLWWQRRPAGGWGIPKAVEGLRIPRWAMVTALLLSIWLLPMVGLTLVLWALWGWLRGIVHKMFRARSGPPQPP